eukprot:EG_transcript_9254
MLKQRNPDGRLRSAAKDLGRSVFTRVQEDVKAGRHPHLKTMADQLQRTGLIRYDRLEEFFLGKEQEAAATAAVQESLPELRAVPVEQVTKRSYNWDLKRWETSAIQVQISPTMFSEGAMRAAHHMLLLHPDGRRERMVAKRQKDGRGGPEVYDSDVVMQSACQAVAQAFNARRPIKRVDFIDTFVIQRPDQSWWAVETFLPGKYVKYNNNWGYVDKDARNTPQAFSHFSYQYTKGRMMVVDIQGVGDRYTDPQIHTVDGCGFGGGNCGAEGMAKFLETHWCNSICLYMGLDFHAPRKYGLKTHSGPRQTGTVMPGQAPVLDNMRLGDFVGDLRPQKGSASLEDLALLGLSERQFDTLAALFMELDTDRSGVLDRAQLEPIFQRATQAQTRGADMRQANAFLRCAKQHFATHRHMDFKTFVLCWTDSA